MGLSKGNVTQVNGTLPMEIAFYLQNRKRKELAELENRYGITITLKGDPSLSPLEGKLDFIKGNGLSTQ